MRGLIATTALVLAGCEPKVEVGRVEGILALEGDPQFGELSFEVNCATCHGLDGRGGTGPRIAGYEDGENFVVVLLGGQGTMQPFESLGDQEIADLLAFVQSL